MERIVIVGASGGIGRGLVEESVRRYPSAKVIALSRQPSGIDQPNVVPGQLDITEEASIISAAKTIPDGGVDRVIVATGMLHDDHSMPEKSWRDLTAENMAKIYAVNSIGPALVLKHFLPLLHRRQRAQFAAISARVGSISDNHLGGWYSYRASKAALNMILKSASIEYERKNSEGMVVGLHPGTVDTGLSKPFQGNVPEDKLFSANHSAQCLLAVLDQMTAADTGKCFAWDGKEIPA
ncbi:SDR family NAD(P)-dependent oxidoreductase [Pseudovibrio sp. SPO723]|uniref:SDR family NAD(P)-dependent oxidoreductase n=1 Tax=Nesiotobacter zosterae TaxID=392721 RepID=UPI0029C249BF|nr:SDR family NAD(P)-dependent oxidoreductase [Pseudovibrio sp. SPO723]MDX5593230.1 SDR family NAD(P)-dependent oxidoreductase [Pseudovibrio sp. SPO723]